MMVASTMLVVAGLGATPRAVLRAAEDATADLYARAQECADRAERLAGVPARKSWQCVVDAAAEAESLYADLPDRLRWTARFEVLADRGRTVLAQPDDVDDGDPRLAEMQRLLRTVVRTRGEGRRPEAARLLQRMREVTEELEAAALGGRRSVAARTLLAEGESLGVESPTAHRSKATGDSEGSRLEIRRRSLERRIADLDANPDPQAQDRRDNLRFDLIELDRTIRLRSGALQAPN